MGLFICFFILGCSGKKDTEGTSLHISKRYNELARIFLESNPDSVFYYTDRALEAGRVLNNHIHDREAHFLQATASRYQGNLEQALAASLKAVSESDLETTDSLDAEIRFLLAQVYTELGQYDEALRELNLALNHFDGLQQSIGIGKCLNCISLIYYRINDLEKGKEYNDSALKIWEEEQFPIWAGFFLHNQWVFAGSSGEISTSDQ